MTRELANELDYDFNSQFYERRIQNLIDWQWEEFFIHGHITGRNYIFEVSYEL